MTFLILLTPKLHLYSSLPLYSISFFPTTQKPSSNKEGRERGGGEERERGGGNVRRREKEEGEGGRNEEEERRKESGGGRVLGIWGERRKGERGKGVKRLGGREEGEWESDESLHFLPFFNYLPIVLPADSAIILHFPFPADFSKARIDLAALKPSITGMLRSIKTRV